MASTMLAPIFKDAFDGLDRFGGDSAWDAYCEWSDAWYAELIAGKTCLDCGNCTKCGIDGHEGVGYCRESGEFVSDADRVEEIGCEAFVL